MKRFTNLDSLLIEDTFYDKAINLGAKLAPLYAPNTPAIPAPSVPEVNTPIPASNTVTPAPTTSFTPNGKAMVIDKSRAVGSVIVQDLQLSPNFKLYDFLASNTAKAKNLTQQSMPSQQIINNLTELCTNILEPIFNAGIRFTISSGWRCPALNDLLPGSADNSYHLSGLACDMNPSNMDIYTMFDKIVALNLPLYELLLETGTGQWIHISYEPTMGKAKKIRRSFKAY